MIKGYQEKLMNIYEKIRENENRNLKKLITNHLKIMMI